MSRVCLMLLGFWDGKYFVGYNKEPERSTTPPLIKTEQKDTILTLIFNSKVPYKPELIKDGLSDFLKIDAITELHLYPREDTCIMRRWDFMWLFPNLKYIKVTDEAFINSLPSEIETLDVRCLCKKNEKEIKTKKFIAIERSLIDMLNVKTDHIILQTYWQVIQPELLNFLEKVKTISEVSILLHPDAFLEESEELTKFFGFCRCIKRLNIGVSIHAVIAHRDPSHMNFYATFIDGKLYDDEMDDIRPLYEK